MRKRFVLAGLAVVAVVLSGCAGEAEPTPTPTTQSPTPTPTPTEEPAAILHPLTGAVLDTAATGPSIAAKIDNHPLARPQIALSQADIVFEELVEGGMTRYVAIWQSDMPDQIGPVRSIRPMDPGIISSFNGIIAYSGGQQRFIDLMQASPVYNAIHGAADTADFMYRINRPAPHNVVLDAQAFQTAHSDLDAPPQQFLFPSEEGEVPSANAGTPATSVNAQFSPGQQRQWACENDAWVRAQNGTPDVDDSGARITATNVLAINVGIGDNGGVPETAIVGSGTGVLVSGCNSIPVNWSKEDATSPIVLTTESGDPVLLAPGKTWIELVPVGQPVVVS
ncbi:DUF3048 domain-containing protein [Humidisolicoccus flavus]|uniref:DUF3048 domain-containing protein n=1 Tax=Humidisolicoccus flavus TaxID=3111414 RepID=UPI003243EF4D